jgi:exosortase A-associated hydrolase 1
MTYLEQVVTFEVAQETLIGILATPKETASTTGVVVIVGGPQYRAGSHRQFVLLARALAAAGYPVLRFDYRGMGDSTGEKRDFLQVTPDIRAAIDALQRQQPSVTSVALWGLCDAASAALLYCDESHDQRVSGLCLLNPWVRSEASLARAHVKHYYLDRLRQKEFWLKLIGGKIAGEALAGLWRNVRLMGSPRHGVANATQAPFQFRMGQAWDKFQGSILVLLSTNDYTAKEFLEHCAVDKTWAGLLGKGQVVRREVADADHTFSDGKARSKVETLTIEWLHGWATH